MINILFVCTGNTCRSPMAMALFNRLSELEPQYGFKAFSAGLSAADGEPASTNAVLAMKNYPGADLSHHRSRMLNRNDVENADLIFTMSQGHKQFILSLYPDAHQKVFTLKEYVYGIPGDIKDPFGGSPADYTECAHEIAGLVKKLFEKLKKN